MSAHLVQADWHVAVDALARLVDTHDGRRHPDRSGAFDQVSLEASIDGFEVRLVRDRGSVLVEIFASGQWHSARNLLAYADGLSANAASFLGEPDMVTVAERWDDITAAADSPDVSRYDATIARVMATRINSGDWPAVIMTAGIVA